MMYEYTIGIPSLDLDVNAVCVCSETRLTAKECVDSYDDYWKTRKKIPAKGVVVEEVA